MTPLLKWMRGIVGAYALAASSYFGTLFLLLPAVPLAFFPRLHRAFRLYTDFFVTAWITYAIGIMRIFHGVNIITHGDTILPEDRALIFMNHRTRLDWFYFWSPALTDGIVYNLKIALKRTLARIPGPGWAQQLASFLFLNRRADTDLPRISTYLCYLTRFRDRAFKLLVFPEGTDFCPASKKRSDAYADKYGLPYYEYVLHPRTTGVEYAFDTLSRLDALDAVYDVTIAYEGPFPNSEMAVISGDLPETVHFFVKRYPQGAISSTGAAEFCQKLWSEKERFLRSFYNHDQQEFAEKFRNGRSEGPIATLLEWVALISWTWFILYATFWIAPNYWMLLGFATLFLIGWSEFTSDSIDDSIVKAGNN